MPEAARAALPALFISDLHLSEDEPANVEAFLAFLEGPAREAASLFILGDLFEYWAGDDDLATPFNARIAEAIRTLSCSGTAVHFMTGNRDLLAGPAFATAIGATLLDDPACVRFGDAANAPVLLLSHGDALCTDDLAYQAYRRQVRDPAWQAGFLAEPLAARKAFIASLRQKSETAKAGKSMEIMDVNAEAVAALLRSHDYPIFVHGHTHRPDHHALKVDGRECARHVLSDWRGAACWLAFDGSRFSAHTGTSAG
ncbi:UDP-2,3-diacylglucosamine diphosphatase [Thauera mechernichensis]|uniref:UDP-2,3-diacylglucosamine hydrolase n=1 Tax=Thauera mechernichensis TaxID=82788 RepID=A0ABW3WG86_9RHOO|nr:UDP-2,3-diacylglucosamine diphosphatase [Thauera mechernichensis]MDG3063859.1 UDP-2,3-diacylglucosamine diphosphatase [Thauera mechernichensis]